MSSRCVSDFAEITTTVGWSNFPVPNHVRNGGDITVAVVFQGDPGYLRIASIGNQIQLKPYATRTTMRREPVQMKFLVNKDIGAFIEGGFSKDDIEIEHNLEGEDLNKAVHLLRCFSTLINTQNGNYARRQI